MTDRHNPFGPGTVPIPNGDVYYELFALIADGPQLVCKLCGDVLIEAGDWPDDGDWPWESRNRAEIDAIAIHGVEFHDFPQDGEEWTFDMLQRDGWYTTASVEGARLLDARLLALIGGSVIGFLFGVGVVTLSLALYPTVPPLPLPVGPEVPPSEHMFMVSAAALLTATLLGLLAVGEMHESRERGHRE